MGWVLEGDVYHSIGHVVHSLCNNSGSIDDGSNREPNFSKEGGRINWDESLPVLVAGDIDRAEQSESRAGFVFENVDSLIDQNGIVSVTHIGSVSRCN